MSSIRNTLDAAKFNRSAVLPFELLDISRVGTEDFRKNARGELGTRTATLHAQGIAKLRGNWIYRA